LGRLAHGEELVTRVSTLRLAGGLLVAVIVIIAAAD
jgi:hypothetical protein